MQDHAKCNFMQSASLCKVQNYAKRKYMQSANLCKVQIYAKCKFMQSTKLGMVQNYAKFETSKHVKYFKSATTSRKISQFRVCLMLISYGSPHDKVTLFFVSIFVCFCLWINDQSIVAGGRRPQQPVALLHTQDFLLQHRRSNQTTKLWSAKIYCTAITKFSWCWPAEECDPRCWPGPVFKANSLLLSDTIVTFTFGVREEKWVGPLLWGVVMWHTNELNINIIVFQVNWECLAELTVLWEQCWSERAMQERCGSAAGAVQEQGSDVGAIEWCWSKRIREQGPMGEGRCDMGVREQSGFLKI